MSTSLLQLPAAAVTVTSHGIRIDGTITLEEWKQLLGSLQSIRNAYHCALADTITYGQKHFGNETVSETIQQMEFDMADATKAIAIGTLTYDFRQKHPLTSEHYHVLSTLAEDPAAQTKWAGLAQKENLTALELKRSIEKGSLIRTADIQRLSGHGTGIATVQGVVFQFNAWQRKLGGTQAALQLPIQERSDLLDQLRPMVELAAALESSLS